METSHAPIKSRIRILKGFLAWPSVGNGRPSQRAGIWVLGVSSLFLSVLGIGCDAETLDRVSEEEPAYFAIEIDGAAWFATRSGAYRHQNDEILHVFKETKANLITKINEDIWIGTVQGMFRFDPASNSSIPILRNSIGKKSITAIEATSDDVWIGTPHGLFRAENENSSELFLDGDIQSIELIDDQVWVSTKKNLIRLNAERPHSFFFDVQGPKWVEEVVNTGGTTWILTVTERGYPAEFYNLEGDAEEPLEVLPFGELLVFTVAEVGDEVWFGTNLGVMRIEDGTATRIGSELPPVNNIAVFPSGVWVGTTSGIYRWQEQKQTLTPVAQSHDLGVRGFARISGEVWLWTDTGVFRFVPSHIGPGVMLLACALLALVLFAAYRWFKNPRGAPTAESDPSEHVNQDSVSLDETKGVPDVIPTPAEPDYDVFLSYNHTDNLEAREIADGLRSRGLMVYLDEWGLPGDEWIVTVGEALRSVKYVAVLVGANGMGSWQSKEVSVALATNTPAIPVLLPGASESDLPSFLTVYTWADLRDGLSKEGLDRLERAITVERL